MAKTPELEFTPNLSVSKIRVRPLKTRRHTENTRKVLRDSILKNGVVEPILVDEDYNLIHGEYRLEITRELNRHSIPALIVKNMKKKEADAYHLMADRLPNWSTWDFPVTDGILSKLDGGLTTEDVLGYEAVSEAGEWRDLAREIGWFIEIVPEILSANTVNLEKLASLLANQLNSESGKYQFSDDQLLYIEGMRKQLRAVREEMVANGEMSETEANEKVDTFSAARELRYMARKYAEEQARSKRVFEDPWPFDPERNPDGYPFKGDASGKMMGLTQFIEYAILFDEKSGKEAAELFNNFTGKELKAYVETVQRKYPDHNPARPNLFSTNGIELETK